MTAGRRGRTLDDAVAAGGIHGAVRRLYRFGGDVSEGLMSVGPGRPGTTEAVMLNERERRVLSEIERRTAVHDPTFAATMRRAPRDPSIAYDVVIALAGASALLCGLLTLPGPGFVAALLAAVAAWWRPRPPLRELSGDQAVDRGGAHR